MGTWMATRVVATALPESAVTPALVAGFPVTAAVTLRSWWVRREREARLSPEARRLVVQERRLIRPASRGFTLCLVVIGAVVAALLALVAVVGAAAGDAGTAAVFAGLAAAAGYPSWRAGARLAATRRRR